MAHEAFVLTGTGLLHRVTRTDNGVQSHVADLAQTSTQTFMDLETAKAAASRLCVTCFPESRVKEEDTKEAAKDAG